MPGPQMTQQPQMPMQPPQMSAQMQQPMTQQMPMGQFSQPHMESAPVMQQQTAQMVPNTMNAVPDNADQLQTAPAVPNMFKMQKGRSESRNVVSSTVLTSFLPQI